MKITKEQIADYKKRYGKVFEISVPNVADNGDEIIEGGKESYSAIFRDIDDKILSLAAKKSAGLSDPVKFSATIVQGCFVDGDVEIKAQSAFINAASQKLQERVKEVEAEVKEL